MTNLKLWGYIDSDLCFSYESDQSTLQYVLSACPQSLQMYTWRHNEVNGTMWGSKIATSYSQGIYNSVSQGRWMPCEETKIPIWNYWMKLVIESVSGTWDISSISSSLYSYGKSTRHCSVVRFKEEYLSHKIDSPLGRKPEGDVRSEEKLIRDTACRLHRKWLDMSCNSSWGW